MNTIAENTGALLYGFTLDGRGGGREFTEAPPVVHPGENGFIWHHYKSDHKETSAALKGLGIPITAIETMTAIGSRPTTISYKEGTLLSLRGVNLQPGSDPEDMISVRIWFNRSTIVTTRKSHRVLLSVQAVREQIENGIGPTSVSEFIVTLVEQIADRIRTVVDDIDDALDQSEVHLLEANKQTSNTTLSALRRQIVAIRRYLAPQRDALGALHRDKQLFTDAEMYDLHRQGERMTRYVEDLDLARERVLVMQEELMNIIAQQQNGRTYVLTIVATIFLPLSFLTGVFGMNVAGLPGTENPNGFGLLSIGMVLTGLVLIAIMYWKKWL